MLKKKTIARGKVIFYGLQRYESGKSMRGEKHKSILKVSYCATNRLLIFK